MDKAALFTEITRRNEVRRKAQLPLLDVRTELDHAVQLAKVQEYNAFCEQHAAKLNEFRVAVMAERRAKNPDYGYTSMGVWAVNLAAQKLFDAWIELNFGMTEPGFHPKNMIVYGQDKK